MRRHCIVLALATYALAAPNPENSHKIPFQRRSLSNPDGTVNENVLFASLSKTLVKYGQGPLPQSLLAKRASGNVPLTDEVAQGDDELYYGSGTVGKQRFTIDFDTGSADLFVPGPNCTAADGCVHSTRYQNEGKNQGKMTTIPYGSAEISGEDYKDKVTVGRLTVPSQGFVSLTQASGLSSAAFEGLMGMGFSTIASTGYPTFVENLISEGKLSKPEFSFFLGRSSSGTSSMSQLLIGGSNPSLFKGKPKAIPVTTKGYWQVALDNVVVNGQSSGPSTEGQAAIDTGTTLILAPSAAASSIFADIPGSIPLPLFSGSATITLWAYPCNTASKYIPKLTFGGTQFAIAPADFNLGSLSQGSPLQTILGRTIRLNAADPKQTNGLCIAGLASADFKPSENLYIVGDVFLKNWYSIYSYTGPTVSFARAFDVQYP